MPDMKFSVLVDMVAMMLKHCVVLVCLWWY